jgi:hypothetical protein
MYARLAKYRRRVRETRSPRWTVGVAAAAVSASMLITASPASAAASPNLFAVVDQSGDLVTGTSGATATEVGTGQYEVTFTRDVSGCAYSASTQNAYSQSLQISTDSEHFSSDGVFVETKNQGGGLTSGPFDLEVNCGGTGMQYAVEGYSGNLVRATSGTTITTLGVGEYAVRFPTLVYGCAYLASQGDPGTGVAYSPSLVSTSTGAWFRTVDVQTRDLSGNLEAGIPFHLSVVCPRTPNAVIDVVSANGLSARASTLTSSFNTAPGQDVVVTDRPLAACAAVATPGATGRGGNYDAATVETVPGPAGNTFGVQTRLPLALGGDGTFTNEGFDSAVFC